MTIPSSLKPGLAVALTQRTPARIVGGTRASVILPLVDRGGLTHIWLIKRPEQMRKHAGQVALPGGKSELGESTQETALRECEEELGFAREQIEVLGSLDEAHTTTGYVVSPVVGWLREDLTPSPNPDEIARAFCVPISLFVHELPRPRPLVARGVAKLFPSWYIDGEIVWGATAHILGGFVKVVRSVLAQASESKRPQEGNS